MVCKRKFKDSLLLLVVNLAILFMSMSDELKWEVIEKL